jgi:hypothetical protein
MQRISLKCLHFVPDHLEFSVFLWAKKGLIYKVNFKNVKKWDIVLNQNVFYVKLSKISIFHSLEEIRTYLHTVF